MRQIIPLLILAALLFTERANAISADAIFMRGAAAGATRLTQALGSLSVQPACGQLDSNWDSKGIIKVGVESNGGNADTYHPNGPACFLSHDRAVRACMSIGSDFGISPEEINRTVRATFDQWVAYIADRHIGSDSPDLTPFAQRLELIDKCDGTEDLKFVFGASDDSSVQKARELYREPWGLASCTRFTTGDQFGHGLIWIAPPKSITSYQPDWTAKNALYAVMLREVGRLFGTGTVSGTIMRENISEYLENQSSWQDLDVEKMRTQIDQTRVLYHGVDHAEHLELNADGRYQYRLGLSFQKLMGRAPQGQIKETLDIVLS